MRVHLNVKRRCPTNSAPSGNDQFAVGKRLHVPICNHDLEVADRRCGSIKETRTDAWLRRLVLPSAREPRLEFVSLADHLGLLDLKPGLFDKFRPLSLG